MLDKLLFEIKIEIMKRLPVKSLIQFRSVSKAFNSLIVSSGFIASYTALQSRPQHLFLFQDNLYNEYESAIIADNDDNIFPQHRATFTIPKLLNWLYCFLILGCSHGLVCFYGYRQEGRGGHRSMAVLWNPSVRKAVGVMVPNLGDDRICWATLGFGVCSETMDPKIVKIKYIKRDIDAESVSCIPSQVEVFALSTAAWRGPYRYLPRKSIRFGSQRQVVVDGFLYWLATDHKITRDDDGGYNNKSYTLIVSFDMKTEEFREVILPDSLALALHTTNHILHINTLRNSLVVIDHNQDENNPVMGIWMRVDGVFTNLYNIIVNTRNEFVTGFRKNGAPIVEIGEDLEVNRELVVYEPNSKNMDSFLVRAIAFKFFVYPYMETLLLHDQPDLMVYNDISMWRSKSKRLLMHTS